MRAFLQQLSITELRSLLSGETKKLLLVLEGSATGTDLQEIGIHIKEMTEILSGKEKAAFFNVYPELNTRDWHCYIFD